MVTFLFLVLFLGITAGMIVYLKKGKSKKLLWLFIVGIVISFFIFIAVAVSDSGDSSKKTTVSEKVLTQSQLDSIARAKKIAEIEARENSTISAENLLNQFLSNEVLADKNYKDKYFFVEGNIESIGKDIIGDAYITFKTSEWIRKVQCMIADEDVVAQLQKGQKITIRGKCSGLLGNVLMRDCEVVKNLSDLKNNLE